MKSVNLEARLIAIREFCRRHGDPDRAAKYSRYFVEGYDAYGLDRFLMERQRDEWLEEYGTELGLPGFLALGDLLVRSGKYEEASFAIWFVAVFEQEFRPETLERLAGWLDEGLRNWAHVDMLSGDVLPSFLTRGLVPLEAFTDWRGAASKWRRRAVPVTLIKPVKTGACVPSLLGFVRPLMTDSEKVVQQGLGWFLREAWKKDPKPTEAFLFEWKDTCARFIIRYATEKMTAEAKARFRKTRPSHPRPLRRVPEPRHRGTP